MRCFVLAFLTVVSLLERVRTSSGRTCHSISKVSTDKWCNDNCNASPANCPSALCKCDGPGPTPPPSPPPPIHEHYDLVIVGTGVTGSTAALELAEQLPGERILILEAGGPSHGAGVDLPGLNGRSWPAWAWKSWPFNAAANLSKFDVPGDYPFLQCWNDACREAWAEVAPAFQCKVLGGCGVMNGELVMLPPQSDFDEDRNWPAGWQWDSLEPIFAELQKRFSVTPTPSADGKHYLDEHGATLFKQALSSAGLSESQQIVNPQNRQGSFGVPSVTAEQGRRQSPVTVFLPSALARRNVELRLWSEVVQLSHTNGTVTGVQIVTQGHASYEAGLKPGGAVVLASGALNTPRLLLQSGIGPSAELAQMRRAGLIKDGTETISNEHVGNNLSDHPFTHLRFRIPERHGLKAYSYNPPAASDIEQFVNRGSGPLAQYGPLLAAYFQDIEHPDTYAVEVFTSPAPEANIMEVAFVLMKPSCFGASVSPQRDRSIAMNLPRLCPRDHRKIQNAVDQVTAAMKTTLEATYVPSGNDWYSPAKVVLSNHWAGSCALGTCVDPETLIVRGTSNVHVVDASIVPQQVTGHPWFTYAAVAKYAAKKIAETHQRSHREPEHTPTSALSFETLLI